MCDSVRQKLGHTNRHVSSTKRGSLSSTIFYNQTRVLKARKRYVVQKKEGTKNGTPLSGRVPA